MFKYGIILFLIVVAVKMLGRFSVDAVNAKATDIGITDAVVAYQKELPAVLVDVNNKPRLQIEHIEYQDHVIRVSGGQLWKQEFSKEEQTNIEKDMQKMYCSGSLKAFHDAKVPVQYVFTMQPRSLNDLRTENWKFRLQPSQC